MNSAAPGSGPPVVDLTAFNSVSYGLYLCSARVGSRRNAALVNTFVQLAEEPCVASVSLSKRNLTHEMVVESGSFGIQVLEREVPLQFLGRFGFRSGRDTDKFDGLTFRDGETGCPVVLEHTLSSFEARVTRSVDCGTHTLFVGDVVRAERLASGDPLTYAYYHSVKGGKTGRNAPGYLASVTPGSDTSKGDTT